MEIAAKYAPQQIEKKWYDYWVEHGFSIQFQMNGNPILLSFLLPM